MKSKSGTQPLIGLLSAGLVLALPVLGASQEQPTTEERVAAIKQSLQQSSQQIRQYRWTETTIVNLKDEEKSRTENTCSYGTDGKVQKVPLAEPAEADEKRGIRGKVVEKKKAELTDYMQKAVALVHAYVPPSPELIQKCKDSGKVAVQAVEPGKRVVVQFRDYHQAGDVVGIEIDIVKNVLLGYDVASFIDSPEDAVNLHVRLSELPDQTVYAADVVLEVKAKDVKINVQNASHTKVSK